MGSVRVLVGTRKGAFIFTSDEKREKWDIQGPLFAGLEIYHIKGSPLNPQRIYASQVSDWFGQVNHRSNDGGQTWETIGNKFEYEGEDLKESGRLSRHQLMRKLFLPGQKMQPYLNRPMGV